MYIFDWDENKNQINLKKHGIEFKEISARKATKKSS